VNGAYKPMNQILLGFPMELNIGPPSFAEIEVNPRVLYHQLLTLEAGVVRENRWTGWLSVTSERPLRDDTPPEWMTQEVSDAVITSAYVGYDVRGEGEYASHVYVTYLRVNGGDARDRGALASDDSFFERRYMFIDAIGVGATHSFPWLSRKWLTRAGLGLTYDQAQHGALLSASLGQKITKYWSTELKGDLLGLVDRSGQVDNGFFANYRANDRVSLGVTYVF
jgi:hypothetical protein